MTDHTVLLTQNKKIYSSVYRASLVAQRLKHLPVLREVHVLSLGWEEPLEKEMATNPISFCLENPMDR